jgi:hypothetical protein
MHLIVKQSRAFDEAVFGELKTEKATAGPSTSLRSAQDDSLLLLGCFAPVYEVILIRIRA